ncbi:MAG: RNA polymerase sigma factor [Rhizobiales bacterium]|nr:RNA polymerase sigma factor [Hyphomicrobiales bacterium]
MFFKKSQQRQIGQHLEEIFPRLWRYCLTLTGKRHLADDLAQAACLRALEKSDNFKSGTKFDRWLFTITYRLWIDELRKKAVRTGHGLFSIEDINLSDPSPNPESHLMINETVNKILKLPEAQRIAVGLVYMEGYSYKEASNILDIPIGTIMSRLSAARVKLSDKTTQKSKAV